MQSPIKEIVPHTSAKNPVQPSTLLCHRFIISTLDWKEVIWNSTGGKKLSAFWC